MEKFKEKHPPKSSASLPLAASALIIHETGLVLSISRKHDFNDLGLPGGKVDPGETLLDAVKRETVEETGLVVVDAMPMYSEACGKPGIHHVHLCTTFLCKVTGQAQRLEKGRVVWVHPQRLILRPNGEQNSFSEYNEMVFKSLQEIAPADLKWFTNNVPLTPERE